MLSKNKIKYLNTLLAKKTRQKYKNFIAEGDKICTEILNSTTVVPLEIYATGAWMEKNETRLLTLKGICCEITESELKKISQLTTPNQVLIVASQPAFHLEPNEIDEELVLYLDGIQDPGNMGTILRNADWFGIRYVFCSDNCVDIFNPKVIQASMGAFLRVKTKEIDLKELISKNIPVYGAVLGGKNIFTESLSEKGIIVIGSEGNGISAENLHLVNKPVMIPGATGGAESLNAAVATGIICALFKNYTDNLWTQ